jgi:hypothetical protein
MDVTIGEYHDFFSTWYGLRDGTLLSLGDDLGQEWVRVDGHTITIEEYCARLENGDNLS